MKTGRTLLVALIASFILGLILFILNQTFPHFFDFELSLKGTGTLLILFLSFLINWFLIGRFYNKKIKNIYNILLSFRKKDSIEQKQESNIDHLVNLEIEVKKWVEERKNEIDQLNRFEKHRKEYIGNVAHELKTPVFNIQGYINTLLDGGLEDESVARPFLEKAENNVERMIQLIKDLDDITRLEMGILELEYEVFDFKELCKEVIENMELKAQSKKISLMLNDSLAKCLVKADRNRLKQVLINLVENSIKYGRENGTTKIRISELGNKYFVEVSDNGLGVATKHLPRLFERFYRVDKSRSRNEGGSGLGLAIVKHIIEAHGETISVLSTEGGGSVFSFTIENAE